MSKPPIERAADVVGSQVALAALLGVTKAAAHQWKDEGRRVPAEHCPVIERETRRIAAERGDPSLIVTCEQLRPDVAWDVLRDQATPQPAETPAAA